MSRSVDSARLLSGFLRNVAQTSDAPMGIVVESASGTMIRAADGTEYLDLLGGIGVAALGHGHPRVLEAIAEQARRHLHVMVYGELVQESQVCLAERLVSLLPAPLDDVYFTTHACPTDATTQEFFEAFEAETGSPPDANFVATGGDLVRQIEAALLAAGSTDGTAVRDAYANLENVEGISGTITYKDAPLPGNPVKDVHVLKWEGGETTCVESFYPEEVPAIE